MEVFTRHCGYTGVYRNIRGCIFEVNPEKLSWYLSEFVLLILTWTLRYSFKKREQQNTGVLVLKWALRHLLQTSIWVWGTYHARPACILITSFSGDNIYGKLLKTPLTYPFMCWLLNSFDLPSNVQNRGKEETLDWSRMTQ